MYSLFSISNTYFTQLSKRNTRQERTRGQNPFSAFFFASAHARSWSEKPSGQSARASCPHMHSCMSRENLTVNSPLWAALTGFYGWWYILFRSLCNIPLFAVFLIRWHSQTERPGVKGRRWGRFCMKAHFRFSASRAPRCNKTRWKRKNK